MSQAPFDDIRALMADLPAPMETHVRPDLGALTPIATWVAAWRGRAEVNRPIVALYAGAHAGCDTASAQAQLEAIAAGEALAAKAVQHLGAGLDVFDLAIDRPVPDIALQATMRERECAATMAFGMEVLAKQPDLLILGAFGEGTQDAAQALLEVLAAEPAASPRARAAAARARAEAVTDPLELLRQLGGRESAALAGAIIAARTQRTPVLLAGVQALAAAAVLGAADPRAIAHCRLSRGHAAAAAVGVAPISTLDLGALDEAAGSVAALGLVKLACALAI